MTSNTYDQQQSVIDSSVRSGVCESKTEIVQFSLALWESAPDAIVVVDPEGRIKQANAMTEQVFGDALRDLVGQPVELLIPERYHEVHRRHRKRYFRCSCRVLHPAPATLREVHIPCQVVCEA